MFNIGGGELIVIMLIALVVLGPQRLPDAARQIGKAMADLRRLSTGFQNEVRSAIDVSDDPTHVTARRNVLAKEGAVDTTAAEVKPKRPSAQERLAAKEAAAKPVPAKKAAPAKKKAQAKKAAVNGTAKKAAAPAKKRATSR